MGLLDGHRNRHGDRCHLDAPPTHGRRGHLDAGLEHGGGDMDRLNRSGARGVLRDARGGGRRRDNLGMRELPGVAGPRAVRNAITLGGNVAHLVYWADMPVALLALNATVEVEMIVEVK